MGHKSIIFVMTYFDTLEQNDKMMGSHEADDTKQYYTRLLTPYTDLGADGIFFIGSLPALMGKINGDQNLLSASHIPPMEKRLEQILFNERGRLKLGKALHAARKANRDTSGFLTDTILLLQQDKSGLATNSMPHSKHWTRPRRKPTS